MKTKIPIQKTDKHYTYNDYKTWPNDERWELINGIAWDMSPAPSRRHQGISGTLFAKIYNYLQNKGCEVYAAPFDVLLPGLGEDDEESVSPAVLKWLIVDLKSVFPGD